MNSIKKFSKKIPSIYLHIGFALFALFSVVFLCVRKFNKKIIVDPSPVVHTTTPEHNDTKKHEIATVKTGLFIRNFPTFDLLSSKFTADAVVWFSFDPGTISSDLISDFSFGTGTILEKKKIKEKQKDAIKTVFYEIRVEFMSYLNFKEFPFNAHRIFLVLENEHLSPTQMAFQSDSTLFGLADNIHTHDWKIINKHVQSGYIVPSSDKKMLAVTETINNPAVIFSLDLMLFGFKKLLIIFLPLFLLFFLGLFSLLLTSRPALSSSLATVGSLIFYYLIIGKIEPKVSHLTTADKIYLMILTSQFLIFLINVASSFFEKKYEVLATSKTKAALLWKVKSAAFYILGSTVVMLTAYFFGN